MQGKLIYLPLIAAYSGAGAGATFTLSARVPNGRAYALIGLAGTNAKGLRHTITAIDDGGRSLTRGTGFLANMLMRGDNSSGVYFFPGPGVFNGQGRMIKPGIAGYHLQANADLNVRGVRVVTGDDYGLTTLAADALAVLIDVGKEGDAPPDRNLNAPVFANLDAAWEDVAAQSGREVLPIAASSSRRTLFVDTAFRKFNDTTPAAIALDNDYRISFEPVTNIGDQRHPVHGAMPANIFGGENDNVDGGMPPGFTHFIVDNSEELRLEWSVGADAIADPVRVHNLFIGYEVPPAVE